MNSDRKLPLILSISAVCVPFITVPIMLLIEPEKIEAILSGLLFGWFIGSILGIVSMILNRKHQQMSVIILSILPMMPTALYFLMFMFVGLPLLFIN